MENAYSVLVGNNRQTLRTLPDQSVHMVATSPPYWGLRDYGTATWEGGDPECDHKKPNADTGHIANSTLGGGKSTNAAQVGGYKHTCGKCGAKRVDDQIGQEETPEQYVATLVEVFREVRRVLREDGVLWLNLGDSYAGGKQGRSDKQDGGGLYSGEQAKAGGVKPKQNDVPDGLKPKDLVGIPWRVAFALQADGWYLRQDIIWAKPNPMPESVQDRCTKAHEYVFLLTKQPRYFYDAEAVKERSIDPESLRPEGRSPRNAHAFEISDPDKGRTRVGFAALTGKSYPTRNRRSVWQVATAPCKEAHFATWPPKLVAPMILAGTSEKGCCPTCGAQWQRVVRDTGERIQQHRKPASQSAIYQADGHAKRPSANSVLDTGFSRVLETAGWRPSCTCGGEPVPCVVLDPFGGSGTTAGVANALGRRAILCELNPTYAEIIPRRVDAVVEAMRARKKVKRPKPSKLQKTLF